MKKPKTKHLISPYDYVLLSFKHIEKANYKKAFETITKAKKLWPNDFYVISYYASIMADYGENLGGRNKIIYKKKACVILKKLLYRTKGADKRMVYVTRNEYYYHSEQFRKQYLLGVERASKKDKHGYYCQGVGAAWHSLNLAKKNINHLATLWANRAIKAWKLYFKINPNYYNSYVHYALALGILKKFKEMENALQKSQKLSGKNKSYKEFKEIRDIIKKLYTPNIIS